MRRPVAAWARGLPLALVGAVFYVEPCQAQTGCRTAKVVAFDGGPFDSFGQAVAVSGDVAMLGAFWDDDNGRDSGSVYAFRFDGSSWVYTQKLLASDGQGDNWFGHAVAVDGDVAMVGAVQHIHDSHNGAVYVFHWNGASWVQVQELLASDSVVGDGFGQSVQVEYNCAVIGAPGDDDNGVNSGSAYIFRFETATEQWVQEQKLLACDGAAGDFFAASVSLSGDAAVAGTGQGESAYVFRLDPRTAQWSQEQKLTASTGVPDALFGAAVSISGSRALIGARLDNDNGGVSSGSSIVFRYDSETSVWIQEQKLLASDGQPGDQLGKSVAIDGDVALVGAWVEDQAGPDHGAAYVFRFNGRSWVEVDKLLPDTGPWTAFFGWSVALDADRAVVGAHGEDVQRGAAYCFAGLSGVDCNDTDQVDSCDILQGLSKDANGNGTPDECECPWDLDGNGAVGIVDFLDMLASWGPGPGNPADFDGDGSVGVTDFLALLANWGPC